MHSGARRHSMMIAGARRLVARGGATVVRTLSEERLASSRALHMATRSLAGSEYGSACTTRSACASASSRPRAKSTSSTLKAYTTGFKVRRPIDFTPASRLCAVERPAERAGTPRCRASRTCSSAWRSSPRQVVRSSRRCTWASSARSSSRLITSASTAGSTRPSTCTVFGSSNVRTTWQMASHSRAVPRNLLPSPSPRLAPLARPATSTHSMVAGVHLSEAACTPSRVKY